MQHSIIEHFKELPDPRVERTKRYPLIEIVFLSICAIISGCEGWKQIKDFGDAKLTWLRQFLPYDSGIPVDDTIARLLRRLDTEAFQGAFIRWMQSVVNHPSTKDMIAVDGKTLRRSHDKSEGKSAIHMVSAWSHANGVVLGQEKTAEKSNEITAIPELLDVLSLEGSTITIDAMGCQTGIAKKIIDKGADYMLAVKDNQQTLHEEIQSCFRAILANQVTPDKVTYHETVDAGHGRVETRRCWTFQPCEAWLPSGKRWVGLNRIVLVTNRREIAGKISEENRYYISSATDDAQQALAKVRSHWGIENRLHWVLDMNFREDESRIRKDAAPENFAVMRHIALNLLKSDTTLKASIKRKLLRAALDDEYRKTVISQII